jgi:hypothetical protein
MTYEQIFPDVQSLKNHIDSIVGQKKTLYSDFGKAVFGYNVYDLDPEFDGVACTSSEDQRKLAKLRHSRPFNGKIYVWEKFGKELTSETVLVSSVKELLDYWEANKANELYKIRDGRSISIVDYGKAAEGTSVIVSLTPEAFASKNLAEVIEFQAVTWMQTLGFINGPSALSLNKIRAVSSHQAPPRPVPSGIVQQIRPRMDLTVRLK